ncbi:bublin coiled-coil protein isoform X3 [Malaclemys terrapin pileata]|uniref:bublin coiled-coil protein isoform X3 n=1 Tax=Malaclemys terrapin pileata TaxID=2991368 RepID=UPI0023A845D1|nr:bublin coiled-coil protein isoform X3 [Malaclemys terrapin pileata]
MSGPNGEPHGPAGNVGRGEEGEDDGFGETALLQCGSLSSGSWPEPNHLLERLPNSCQMAIPSWSVTQRICSNKLHAGPNQLLFGSPGGEE